MDKAGLDELLERARRRDPAALANLVERFSSRVFGLLFRLTGRRDVAEDLLQETFLRVVREIERYEHTGKFESWLFRIAANLVRDRARSLGRRGEAASLDAGWGDEEVRPAARPADTGDPLGRLVQRELGDRLSAGLGRLSDAEREIILLRHYAELPFREIADLLGIPLGTALARAHRALQHLRAELADAD